MIYIIILLIFAVALFYFGKKTKGFYKAHEFTVKYVLFSYCAVMMIGTICYSRVQDKIAYDNRYYYQGEDPFNSSLKGSIVAICVLAAVYIIIRFLLKSKMNDFYNNNRFTVNSIFLSCIITLSALFKGTSWAVICGLICAAICIYMALSYKSRVLKFATMFTYNVVNKIDKQNKLMETAFFSQPKVKRFLKEKTMVDGDTNYHYLQSALRIAVLSSLKQLFSKELSEKGDKIFFFYSYYYYEPYLAEQNMDLIDTLDSFKLINSSFCYVQDKETGDGGFFSQNILDEITQNFIAFLKSFPKLSGVPFSVDYLFNTMYSNGFLNPYFYDEDLELLKGDRELYEGDFLTIYDGAMNEEMRISLDNGQIKSAPKQNENDEDTYILNHEDANGVISEEYGQACEQHRGSLDIDEPVDELAGCPV